MLSKRYESTEVDRRTWLHVSSGTHWSISSDTYQVVIYIHLILGIIIRDTKHGYSKTDLINKIM